MKKNHYIDENRRIALFVNRTGGYSRGVIRGIMTYVRPAKTWIIDIGQLRLPLIKKSIASHPCGIIAQVVSEKMHQFLEETGIPYIDVSCTIEDSSMFGVYPDNMAVGKMAAEHFLERGFSKFGFLGAQGYHFSTLRESGYQQTLQENGYSSDIFRIKMLAFYETDVIGKREAQLSNWLKELPLPVAIFGCNDGLALKVIESCRQIGLNVPTDVAILGVDNDEQSCLLEYPPLSSIVLPNQEIGYQAAKRLDLIFEGRTIEDNQIVLPPKQIVLRQSSDIVAIADKVLAAALGFIRARAGDLITVNDVCDAVFISRRSLEQRFKKLLGYSPLEEIRRTHIKQAKQLLTDTDMSISEIAINSGFSCPERLSIVFRRCTGITPTDYRQQFRNR